MSDETRYGGTYLRVELSAGRIDVQTVDEATQRAYPGGSSYGARVLYDEVSPGASADRAPYRW
jgi:aldehyde:ferredoxin oxidoreductase